MTVPKLRFRGFSGEWEESPFGNYLNGVSSGKSSTLTMDDGEYSIYGSTGEIGKSQNYDYSGDKILIARVGVNAGSIYRVDGNYKVSDNTLIVNLNKNLSTTFTYYLLNKINLNRLVFGSGQPLVTGGQLKKLKVFLPDIEEQEKIAGFLSTVDVKISGLEKKKELLEKYKKGMMQKIFTKQIRFKGFTGTWEEKPLGEIGNIVTGKTPSTADKTLWNGDILFVTPTDIVEGGKYQDKTVRTVNSTAAEKILPPKSIMYTCIASIGKMSLSLKPSITNQQINSLIPKKEYSNEFIFYALLWLTPKVVATQSNNTLPIINKTEFSKFKLLIPESEEQREIADLLTILDDKIELQNKKLQQAKKFKKSLLQRMFV